MERCHLYAQIKLAKNIAPFKVPAVHLMEKLFLIQDFIIIVII